MMQKRFAFGMALLLGLMGQAHATFDPVNDDTDIFLANPNITAERPNVLIILDNTANWSQAFDNEKSALVQVVNGLDDRYNVGLMLFNQNQASRQNPLDNGSFVAFHVRQMTSTNKSALASLVGGFVNATYNNGGQKADANPIGLSIYEAYLYYAGAPSRTGWNQSWADFPSNTYAAGRTSYTNALTGHALPASPTPTSHYISPIADGCQKNYIIYISNGAANESASLRSELQGYLATLTGSNPPTTISITPNGQQGNWADEMAQYMHSADVNGAVAGTQNVTTYTVEVDPNATGQGPSMTSLLTSMSSKGGGKYFGVTSGDSGVAITDALNKIFSEVQAVNSVFASTTLPVSVNVRGTNLNQVYIGVFRPDANKDPRWIGNLKLFDLKLNTANGIVYLADARGAAAEDPNSGFVTSTATSFWTSSTLTPTNFWSFRTSDVNGAGGSSDAPDGDLVEKGGNSQQIRHTYQSSQTARNLYTCTTGGAYPACTPCDVGGSGTSQTCSGGSSLSSTPFNTANTAISVAALNLSTQSVAALSGKRTVAFSGLTDRKSATLTRTLSSGSSAIITNISSGSVANTRTINSLTTAAPVSITNITSGTSTSTSTTNTALAWTFTLTHANGNTTQWDITTGTQPSAPSGQTFTNTPTITSAVSGNTTIASTSGTCTGIATPTINVASAVAAGTGPNTSSGAVTGSSKFNGAATCTVTLNLNSTYNYTSTTTSSTATVTTATPHGYLSGQSVTTSGLSNNALNCTLAGITVVTATSFTCSLASAQFSSGSPAITGSVSANSQIITATIAGANYVAGDQVIITGANPSGYNGTYTVLTNTSSVTVGKDASTNFTGVTGWTAPTTVASPGPNTFKLLKITNSTANLLAPNSATPVYAVKTTGATTVSSLTLSFAANPFAVSDALTISGATVGSYNTSSCTVTATTATTATCTQSPSTAGPLPDDGSGTGTAANNPVYGTTVTAAVTGHGFLAGEQVMMESVGNADASFAASLGPYTIVTVPDADHFTFTTAFTTVPTGSYTTRPNSPLAYVTAVAHGFSSGNAVTIAGAAPAAYNLTTTASALPSKNSNLMVIDADHFTYPIASAPGTATANGTASINTTTATVNAVNHGFSNGASIAISGASPSVFNGTWTITVTDANHFTYTLPSAQGDATGTIVAVSSTAGASLRDNVINWVRGADNAEDENANGLSTDIRSSIHGDVLHSRPAVVNYSRFGGDNDIYVFYGANDGIFHAVKGGMATDSSDTSGLSPGQEAWGFIPTDFFSSLPRMRNNSPTISSFNKKPYFADGPIGVYTKDANNNNKLGDSGDAVNLYIGMRRGGRFIYALDVNDPADPKLLWKISNSTSGFSELGQTWSEPKVVSGIAGYANPVLIFGAGYDPSVEDVDPTTISASTDTTVTTGSGVFSRTMGRGIYVVDAITGQKIASIGGNFSGRATVNNTSSASNINSIVSGMDYSISSDVTVIKNESGGPINRAYVGDTGGNLWRIDFGCQWDSATQACTLDNNGARIIAYDSSHPENWVHATKIGSISNTASSSGRRKFLFPPDVVNQGSFDAVLLGSGDREHPFDTTVINRMYMFKDRGNDNGPYTGTAKDILPATPDGNPDYPTVTESTMYDATNNCLQDTCSGTTIAAESTLLTSKDGWYVTLGGGEKIIGNAIALGGTVFFNTNQPSAEAGGGSCGSNLGIARQYQIAVADATAIFNLDTTVAPLNKADRSKEHEGGGYLPSPVHVVVQFVDANGQTVTKEAVISGTEVSMPSATPLMSRYRKYWYKEIDQ